MMKEKLEQGINILNVVGTLFQMALSIIVCYYLLSTDSIKNLHIPNDIIEFSFYSKWVIMLLQIINFYYSAEYYRVLMTGNFYEYSVSDSECTPILFLIFKLLTFLCFLSLYGFSLFSGEITSDNLLESTCTTGYFKDINDTQLKLKDIWCKSKYIESEQIDIGCECYIPDYSIWSEEDQAKLKNENEYQKIKTSEFYGELTVQTCSIFNKLTRYHQSDVEIIKKLELSYECSGICEHDILYYFQDVSKSIPKSKHGCFYFVIEQAKQIISYMQILTQIYFYSLIYDTIPIILTLSVFLIQEKEKLPSNDFQDLQNMDNSQVSTQNTSDTQNNQSLNIQSENIDNQNL